jgi:hypothetical protein
MRFERRARNEGVINHPAHYPFRRGIGNRSGVFITIQSDSPEPISDFI